MRLSMDDTHSRPAVQPSLGVVASKNAIDIPDGVGVAPTQFLGEIASELIEGWLRHMGR